MSWRLTKVQMYLLTGIIIIILLFFTGLYYLQISPMKTAIESKKTEVETQQTVLDSISSKLNQSTGTSYQSTMELQKKLPVKPLGDQLILDFEKAEVISNSLILKMELKDEELTEEGIQSAQTAGNTEAAETNGAANNEANPGDSTSDEKQNEPPLPLPQGVKRLSVKVTVQADTYADIEKFIETMEAARRIIKVDSIDFVGTEEVTSIEQNTEPLVYTLGISAFYSPDLMDLQKQLPDIETPLPADKDNPLSIGPDVYEQTKKEDQ